MDRTRWVARTAPSFILGALTLPASRLLLSAIDDGDATATDAEIGVGLMGALLIGVVAGILTSGRWGWLAMVLGVAAASVVGQMSEEPGYLLFIVGSHLVLLGIPALIGYGLGRLGMRRLGRADPLRVPPSDARGGPSTTGTRLS